MDLIDLVKQSRRAQPQAYAPYSGFRVGAALLTATGEVFTGVNVENASYGLTVCAERNAVFRAVAAGAQDFIALAVTSSGPGYIYPCGACLQVLSEFSSQMKIVVTDQNDDFKVYDLNQLLPRSFVYQGRGVSAGPGPSGSGGQPVTTLGQDDRSRRV